MSGYDLSKVPSVDINAEIPAEEFRERVKSLRAEMARRGLDIGFAYATPYMPGDVLYLTGFDTTVENATLLISQDKLFVLCGPEGSYVCRSELRYGEYRIVDEFKIPTEEYVNTPTVSIRSVIDELTAGKIKKAGILTRPDVITVETIHVMRTVLGNDVEFVDAGDILYGMRFVKSANEQAILRISNRICIEAVKAMIESVKPGMREFEITAVGDYVMKKMGAYAYGFDSFVCSGERSNTIMGRGTGRIIREGDPVSIGAAARFAGYASTARRMTVAGGFTQKHIAFYEIGARGQEIAAENFRYGAPRNGIEKAVCEHFKRYGLFQYKVYSVAHGTGITECMEAEAFTSNSPGTIPKNISMMLDVGIYFHPEFHGFSFENPYLINDKGETERLADYPLRTWEVL